MGFPAVFELSSLNGTNGFIINGINIGDELGTVSNAGDVNGDGFDDLIIGAKGADVNGTDSGQSYVVFGKSGGFSSTLNLSTLNGTNGFTINGLNGGDFSGTVSSAGDVNGDGFDDLIIGAKGADVNGTDSGQSYVVFGKSGGFSSILNLSTLNGTNGFTINGINDGNWSGYSVSSAGDVNGDGFDDLIIGAPVTDANDTDSGQSYVVFGKSGGFSSILNLSTLNGTNGFIINGNDGEELGISVSNAGDVNSDGFDDLIIGGPFADANGIINNSGQSYVVFGKSGGFSPILNPSTLNGTNGFTINGISASNWSGYSVSSAGDVNGDGFDDLIIGAPIKDVNGNESGQSYVVFGKSGGFSPILNLSTLNGTNGFIINGINAHDFSGTVSSAGDVNGDGFDDLIIGAYGADVNGTDSGQSYIIFGRVTSLSLIGTSGNDSLTGNTENDTLQGLGGNDTLQGLDGNDSLVGGTGADSMVGGNGNDTYNVDNTGDQITENLNEGTDTVQSSISYTLGNNLENLTLSGTANINGTGNTLNNRLTGNSGDNNLNGGDGNDTLNGASGADTLIGGNGNDTYTVDNLGDVVTETLNAGTDLVNSSVTYTLAVNVENLTLTGTTNINGIGNALANRLTGNSGNNSLNGGDGNDTLNGGVGDDTLIGSLGDDFYYVDNTSDVVIELASQGTDTVISTISYTLIANVENLTLNGSTNINGIGNTLNNFITGNTGNNSLNGGDGNDTLLGGDGNDTLMGDNGNDSIVGGNGNDSIGGGVGNDTMTGGVGNDSYTVDSSLDVVIELANQGTDLVFSSLTYTLTDNLENLTLTGTTAINGIGNTLNNLITGNSGNNNLSGGDGNDTLNGGSGNDTLTGGSGNDTLDGGIGADSMVGGLGDDTYSVDNTSSDRIVEALNEGTDLVFSSVTYTLATNLENLTLTGIENINATGNILDNRITGNSGNNSLNGGDGNDTLTGGSGNDTLNGSTGVDSMVGGLGDDTYSVDNIGDMVVEIANQGIDTVLSSLTYTLTGNVENLTLTGTTAINGIGNTLNNLITGNSGANNLTGGSGNDTLTGGSGNDTLDGGVGNDTLTGGSGNDTYYVDNSSGDMVVELLNEGTDLVFSSVTYTLTDNLENLTLTGTTAINGTGNTLNNLITGNSGNNNLSGGDGNDTLTGGSGNDSLTGGSGNDSFRFNSTSEGIDRLTDFNITDDTLRVLGSGFGGGLITGTLLPTQFTIGSSATTSAHRFFYNSSTGGLFFDSDGSGATAAVQFATLSTGLALTNADLVVI
ncbi:hypothetical protein [Geminocystis sp. GBBB08]|uniref:beta strand repeat-containing protein n=1 Tax=Geminocystis sp. GBBB08 TaxID=2604140 RepID=UPI0027E23B1C|nr:hypothetical protein [Geminocystis sp. GBBB08]MBL1208511.1 hypothetical protein [Geminocystis sp. GBBB08]